MKNFNHINLIGVGRSALAITMGLTTAGQMASAAQAKTIYEILAEKKSQIKPAYIGVKQIALPLSKM